MCIRHKYVIKSEYQNTVPKVKVIIIYETVIVYHTSIWSPLDTISGLLILNIINYTFIFIYNVYVKFFMCTKCINKILLINNVKLSHMKNFTFKLVLLQAVMSIEFSLIRSEMECIQKYSISDILIVSCALVSICINTGYKNNKTYSAYKRRMLSE